MKRIAICLICALLGVSALVAQLPTAAILGQVKDATGATVAGAKVTARNVDTSQTRTVVTSDDGSYRLDALPVGNYEISAERAGFKTEIQSGLTLTVDQHAVANFTIQVGEMSQTVAVTAEAPLVSTTTSSLGGLVDSQRIVDLPLNGRNYVDLTLLQPGVTEHVFTTKSSLGSAGTDYSANGAPYRSNSYLLDGALLVSPSGNNGASVVGNTLGVDGILEYRVITNNFSAEYGMTMGSQMVLVSKSGSNQFHGDAFDFLRNSVLDSRNYFDLPPAKIGHRIPEFRRNNFGGALGGPIKKDKTFFFGVYEQVSQALSTTNTASVLPVGCHGVANQTILPGPFPNCPDINAPVKIAPQMAPLVALYDPANIGISTLGFVFPQPTLERYGQMRVDQTISNSDTVFARYTIDQASQTSPYDLPEYSAVIQNRDQWVTLSESHIFSTSLLNTARFSFSRYNILLDADTTIPINSTYSFVPGQPIGQLQVSTLTNLGTQGTGPSRTRQNIFTWSDDLVYTRGRHSLKFGAILNHYQLYRISGAAAKGSVTFAGVGAFLAGTLQTFNEAQPGSILDRTFHYNAMGFYVQDDWRLTPRLTLNLGMRYEPMTTWQEVHGIQSALVHQATDAALTLGPIFRNPSLRNWSPRFGFAWDVFGDGRTSLRGGFSILYDLFTLGGSPYVSASNPPFVATLNVSGGNFTLPYVPPPTATATIGLRGAVYNEQQPHMLTYNLTVERQLPGSLGLSVSYAGSRGINLLQNKEGNPEIPNGIPANGVCAAAPAGTTINLASQVDGQATSCFLAPPAAAAFPTRLNPHFASFISVPAGGDSFYNALEVLLNKRLSKGLQLQSSYTWSHLIDDTEGVGGQDDSGSSSDVGTDPLHNHTDRGSGDFDLRNNWRLNAIYHLPDFTTSKGFRGKLENGWWTSGIYTILSGYPYTVFLAGLRSQDQQQIGQSNPIERPDVFAGRFNTNISSGASMGCGTGATRAAGGSAIAAGTPLGTPTLLFDPCAFYTQPQGFLGNEPLNVLPICRM